MRQKTHQLFIRLTNENPGSGGKGRIKLANFIKKERKKNQNTNTKVRNNNGELTIDTEHTSKVEKRLFICLNGKRF